MSDNALVKIDAARRALAEARSVAEVKDVRDKADAVARYLRQRDGSLETANYALELRLRAERRLGEMLAEGDQRKGRPGKMSQDDTFLPDGIDRNQSSRWQAIARIPEKPFEAKIAETVAAKKELTQAVFLRLANLYRPQHNGDEEAEGDPSEACGWEVIHGDCVETLKAMPVETARLIFADPPYNIGIDYGDGEKADRLPEKQYLEWVAGWVTLCYEKLTPDGSMWVLIGDEYAADYHQILKEAGFAHRNWIIWYETFGVNCENKFNRTKRHLFYAVKNPRRFVFNADCEAARRPSDRQLKWDDARANPDGKLWDDVWGVPIGKNGEGYIPRLVGNSKERIEGFPTQLPLALLKRIILCASSPDDLVIDPFSGSATTGVAALKEGRRYIGIEKQIKFVEASRKRLRAVQGELFTGGK